MSEEAKPDPKAEKTDAAPPATAKAGTALPMLLGAVVGALALGGVLGSLVLGPRIVASRGPQNASHEEAASEGKKDHGKKKSEKKPEVYRLENLIVNPAGSQGSRFLMATVAVEVPDEESVSQLREHEVQIRDAVTSVLEAQTMEMLTRAGARDSLRHQLAAVVGPLADEAAWVRVYLPQFVIQ